MVLFNLTLTSVSVLNLFNKYIVLLFSLVTFVFDSCSSRKQCLDVVEVLSRLRFERTTCFLNSCFAYGLHSYKKTMFRYAVFKVHFKILS